MIDMVRFGHVPCPAKSLLRRTIPKKIDRVVNRDGYTLHCGFRGAGNIAACDPDLKLHQVFHVSRSVTDPIKTFTIMHQLR